MPLLVKLGDELRTMILELFSLRKSIFLRNAQSPLTAEVDLPPAGGRVIRSASDQAKLRECLCVGGWQWARLDDARRILGT